MKKNLALTVKQLKNLKTERLFTTLLIVIIIVLILFLIFRGLGTPQPEDKNPLNSTEESREYIQFKDPKVAFFGDKKITLPETWKIIAYYKNPQNTTLSCKTIANEECVIYELFNEELTFYLSTPAAYKKEGFNKLNTEKIKLFGKDLNLIKDEADVVIRQDEESGGVETPSSEKIMLSGYVCTDDSICLSSGQLSIDLETNKMQRDSFKKLVSELKLEVQ